MEDLGIEGTEVSIQLFDQLALAAYSATPNQDALRTINAFFERTDIIDFLIPIIEQETSMQAKYAAFAGLKQILAKNWDFLDSAAKVGYKQFIISQIGHIYMRGGENTSLLNMANSVLIAVLEEDWPDGWPDFIDQILQIMHISLPLFNNYLAVFRSVCEDVSKNALSNITSEKFAHISRGMPHAFEQLCPVLTMITKETDPVYIKSTLQFIEAIAPLANPIQFLQSPVFPLCLEGLLLFNQHLHHFLSIFTSISNVAYKYPEYRNNYAANIFIKIVEAIIAGSPQQSPEIDWSGFELGLMQKIINFFDSMLMHYRIEIENSAVEALPVVLKWIVDIIATNGDSQIQKGGFEFWSNILTEIFKEKQNQRVSKYAIYNPFYEVLIMQILLNMEKPYDIFNGEDQFNRAIIKDLEESDSSYSAMRQCLIILINFDPLLVFTAVNQMFESLSSEFSVDIYRKFCWTMAAIGNALPEDSDEGFTLEVYNKIYWQFYTADDDESKAMLANEFLYLTSKCTRILNKSYQLFYQIIEFVLDMMIQNYDIGIAAMSVHAFQKIANDCLKNFIDPREGSVYLEELLGKLDEIVASLERFACISLYECLTKMIISVNIIDTRAALLQILYTPLTIEWGQAIADLTQVQLEEANTIIYVLKCFTAIFANAGLIAQPAIEQIYLSIIEVYQNFFVWSIEQEGKFPWMKSILQSCIGAIESFSFSIKQDSELGLQFTGSCAENFAISYSEAPPQYRVSEIPMMFGILISTLGSSFTNEQLDYLSQYIFVPTCMMIMDNQQDFVSFRKPLVKYIRGLLLGNLPYFVNLPMDTKNEIMNVITHLINSPYREIAADAVALYKDFIDQNSTKNLSPEVRNDYFTWICNIALNNLFMILSDLIHKFMFDDICMVIKAYLSLPFLIQHQEIALAILGEQFPDQAPNFFSDILTNLIQADNRSFAIGVRDLMISLEKLTDSDPLFMENIKESYRRTKYEDQKVVPGMVTPKMSQAETNERMRSIGFDLAMLKI